MIRMSGNQPKKDKKNSESSLKDVGWFALKTVAISGAVLGGTAIALPAIGFTAGGVAAGSLAASFQSAFLGGTIASGSAFALLQSAGAAGLAASTQAAVLAGSAAVAGAHSLRKKFKKNNDEEEEVEENNDDTEEKDETNKIKNAQDPTANPSKNNSTGKCKEFPVKFVKSHRNDNVNNTFKMNNASHEVMYEDEIDYLRKKWEDVELSNDVTITQHLIKK